jgi:GTP cyclohydrolase I
METAKCREPLTEDERERFEGYAAEIFSRMGMDVGTSGTRETPRRWVTALWDMTEGYDGDPKLSTLFPVDCPTCPEEEKTHVVEGPIRFTGLCEHHVLPIHGSVWVEFRDIRLAQVLARDVHEVAGLHDSRFHSLHPRHYRIGKQDGRQATHE